MRKIKVDENIRLKEIGLEDVEAIYKTIDREREYLSEWLPFVEETTDISYTQAYVQSVVDNESKELICLVFYKNYLVGLVGTKDTDFGNKKTEIGYWLSENYQHKGIITKSCNTLIQYAFNELDLNRIQIKAAVGNHKSQRVAERLGFQREGIEREGELHAGGFVDLVVFSLLRKEF